MSILLWLFRLIPGVESLFTAWITAQSNTAIAKLGADKDVALAQLAAETAANQAKAVVLAIPGIRWILFGIYAPVMLHETVIILGRINFIVWDVSNFLPWEHDILMSLVVLVPGMTGAGALHRWATK